MSSELRAPCIVQALALPSRLAEHLIAVDTREHIVTVVDYWKTIGCSQRGTNDATSLQET
jgi:hypothetical protein